jgi:hypothetical protein
MLTDAIVCICLRHVRTAAAHMEPARALAEERYEHAAGAGDHAGIVNHTPYCDTAES